MRQPTTGDAHLLALDAFRGIRIMTQLRSSRPIIRRTGRSAIRLSAREKPLPLRAGQYIGLNVKHRANRAVTLK